MFHKLCNYKQLNCYDFGIVAVEAQACGTPVIAFGKGGALETVVDAKTGVLFYEQTEKSLIDAVKRFESDINKFDVLEIRKNAERFPVQRFKKEFKDFVSNKGVTPNLLIPKQRGSSQ